MLPYGSKVNHVFGQQQRLLHHVSHVPSRALLKVSNGGVTHKRSSIQLHAWGSGWGFNLVVTPPLYLVG